MVGHSNNFENRPMLEQKISMIYLCGADTTLQFYQRGNKPYFLSIFLSKIFNNTSVFFCQNACNIAHNIAGLNLLKQYIRGLFKRLDIFNKY
jgi:hypothetical protein